MFDMPSAERVQIDRTLSHLVNVARKAKAAGRKTPYVIGLVVDEDEEGELQISQFGNLFIDDSGFNLLEKRMPYTVQEYDEKEGEFVIRFEMPGIPKESISLDVKDKDVRVTGGTGDDSYEKLLSFARPLDTASARARFDSGILTLRIKPREPEKPKVVKVQVE